MNSQIIVLPNPEFFFSGNYQIEIVHTPSTNGLMAGSGEGTFEEMFANGKTLYPI